MNETSTINSGYPDPGRFDMHGMTHLNMNRTTTVPAQSRGTLRLETRLGHRQHSFRRHGFRCRVIKPKKEPVDTEKEVVDESELPEYVPDPLMNADYREDESDITKLDPERRTTKIIVDLVNAGGYFEDKMVEYREYLNEDLLEKFYKRIEFAEKHENANAAEGLRLIWRRVRAEVERLHASPALRLLDKLLGLLHPAAGGTSEERYRSALGLMHESFTGSSTGTVNIFEIAQALAEGSSPPPDLAQESVSKNDFIAETRELLIGSAAAEIELKQRQVDLQNRKSTSDTNSPEYRILCKHQKALERFLEDREASLKDVRVLIEMATACKD